MKWSNKAFEEKYVKQVYNDLRNMQVIDDISKPYKQVGNIISVEEFREEPNGKLDIIVKVLFKQTAISCHLLGSALKFARQEVIDKWLTDLPKLFADWLVVKAEEDKIKRAEERRIEIEREIAKEEKKRILRYEKRVAKELDKVNNMEELEITDNFYTALGWLAKHTTSISAIMPDFMENWFIGKLGRVRRSIVRSDEYTTGGYALKWSLSMSLRVDTLDNLPGYLIDKIKKNKALNNTRLVFELCDRYGFKVGDKAQDVEAIRDNIPTEHLEEFEIGVNS